MSFDLTAKLNPEFVRILRTSLPARRIFFIAGGTIAVLLIVIGLIWNSYSHMALKYRIPRVSQDSYWVFTVSLFGLLFVLGPAMTALSFIQEKLRGTAIFQQMVMLTPFEVAAGKFIGSGLISYVMAAMIMPFALVAGVLGNENRFGIMRVYLFLIVGGLCIQAVGLFVSSLLSGPTEKALRGGLLVGPAVGVLGAISALFFSRYFYDYAYGYHLWHKWGFYGVQMRAPIIILGLAVFIGVWAFAGAVRRIKISQLIPVRPWPVWLFFASAEAVLVGLLWGFDDSERYSPPPIAFLVLYLFLNWAVLMILAGSSALDRGRLREWWSAGQDPLSVFQRGEIKNDLLTFIVALGLSELGLIALWSSYHVNLSDFPFNMAVTSQLVPIAISFALTVAGMVAFIQYCAMHRFRMRGWAGVSLAVLFYIIMGVMGALFETKNNTPALINPLVYAYALCEEDPYMDIRFLDKYKYDINGHRIPPLIDTETIMAHGLLAEGLLALGCFGLAYVKWRKTQDEMLQEQT